MLKVLRCEEVPDTTYGVLDVVSALRGRPGADGSQCRFVLIDARSPDFAFCDSDSVLGSSYCDHHRTLTTKPKGLPHGKG